MVYIYQIFGLLHHNEEQLAEINKEINKEWEPWEGLLSRVMASNIDEQVASAMYFCETYEAVLEAKKRMEKIVDQYSDFIVYTQEFIYNTVDVKQINWKVGIPISTELEVPSNIIIT